MTDTVLDVAGQALALGAVCALTWLVGRLMERRPKSPGPIGFQTRSHVRKLEAPYDWSRTWR